MRRVRQDPVSVLFHCLKMMPMVRAQDKVHLWYDLVQQGLLWNNRKAWEWRHRGCGGSGSTHLSVEMLQMPKVSSTAFLGIYPLPSPHETAAAVVAVAAHTPRALLFVPWGSTTNSLGS